ncbi:MAG: YraN family protein [Planctomycetes bacterium]|nr:YraN family protein [Planctomycetota bacterium]
MRFFRKFFPSLNRSTADLGAHGEKLARKFLKRLGYRILKTNYWCPLGELDIVAADGDTIVFIEVKTLRSDQAADPEVSVNWGKRCKITKVARYFIAQTNSHALAARFDVIAVVVPETGKPTLTHFIDAFGPTPK